MLSWREKNGFWYNSEGFYNRFSGPYVCFLDESDYWCICHKLHRLYGFAKRDISKNFKWCVNHKLLGKFKKEHRDS